MQTALEALRALTSVTVDLESLGGVTVSSSVVGGKWGQYEPSLHLIPTADVLAQLGAVRVRHAESGATFYSAKYRGVTVSWIEHKQEAA